MLKSLNKIKALLSDIQLFMSVSSLIDLLKITASANFSKLYRLILIDCISSMSSPLNRVLIDILFGRMFLIGSLISSII